MIELDPKTATVTVTECLSFDCHVLSDYEEIRSEVEHEVVTMEHLKDSFTPEESESFEGMQDFVDHKLTIDDKNEILQYIIDEYERTSNYFESASLFDEKLIHECILSWIQDTFGFEANY